MYICALIPSAVPWFHWRSVMTPQFPTTVLQQEMFFVFKKNWRIETGGHDHTNNIFQEGMLVRVPKDATWTWSNSKWTPKEIVVSCHHAMIFYPMDLLDGQGVNLMDSLLGPFDVAIIGEPNYLVQVKKSTNKNPEDWSIWGQACGELHLRSIKKNKAQELPQFELLRDKKVLLRVGRDELYTVVEPLVLAPPKE